MELKQEERYIPALNQGWLTPLYDPLLKWVMREDVFKPRLIAQAGIQKEHRVLDLGSGTGTLTILIKQFHPDSNVTGLDGDPQVLGIAREKAAKAGLEITWDEGMAFQLPYPDRSFDWVLSSLVIHHLTTENKLRTFHEVQRVLKPGGEFHLADFGKPQTRLMRLIAVGMSRLEETADNFKGALPFMLQEAGFLEVQETQTFSTAFGPLSLLLAVKPL